MKRLILIVVLLASPALAATEYPLADRQRMHEQSCITNAPDRPPEKRAAWIASCMSAGPSR